MNMNTVSKTILNGLTIVIASGFAQIAMAQDAAKVIFKSGNAIVKHADGSEEALSKNSALTAGDTIETRKGRVQFKTVDGGKVSLQPETIFKFKRYEFSGKEDGSEYAITELVKGGLRTITGVIGHKNRDRYQLKTPVATIGIRGTEFSLTYTNKLVMSTLHGSVDVCNAGGCINAITGQSVLTNAFNAKPIYTQEKAQVGAAPASKTRRVFVKARKLDQVVSLQDTLENTIDANPTQPTTPVFRDPETKEGEDLVNSNSNSNSVNSAPDINQFDANGFNAAGFDANGFDADGFNAAGYDINGFDANGFNIAGFNANGFNAAGFDANGYDVNGFNAAGYDANGFDANGFNTAGFDANGFNATGFNANGYDVNGFNAAGFDANGFDANGFNLNGYDANGLDINGIAASGYDINGFDINGFDINGYDVNGYNAAGFDANGYDVNGFNAAGFNVNGFDVNGYNTAGYDANGYNAAGFNMNGFDTNGYNAAGFDANGYNTAGFNAAGFNVNGQKLLTNQTIMVTSVNQQTLQSNLKIKRNGQALVDVNGKLIEFDNGNYLAEPGDHNNYVDDFVTLGGLSQGSINNNSQVMSYIMGQHTTQSQLMSLASQGNVQYTMIAATVPALIDMNTGAISSNNNDAVSGFLNINYVNLNYNYQINVDQTSITDGQWTHKLNSNGTLANNGSFSDTPTVVSTHSEGLQNLGVGNNNTATVQGQLFGENAERAGIQYGINVESVQSLTNTGNQNHLTGSIVLAPE